MANFLLSLLLALPLMLGAYYNPGAPTGFVNDFTATLTTQQRQDLEATLKHLEQESHVEFSIVIIRDLGGDTIENFAEKLFKEWGIGKKGVDNGLLLLIALTDRKMRFEVGYGLEGAITDALSHRIITNILKPAFKQGNFYAGIIQAVQTVKQLIEPNAQPDAATQSVIVPATMLGSVWLARHWHILKPCASLLFVILFLIIFFVLTAKGILKPRPFNRSNRWSDGNGPKNDGGSFGGFGGGSSGGGGNSGDW